MVRRAVVALLGPVRWTPPETDPADWRAALAEDVIDLIATLNTVQPAIAVTAADRPLAEATAWPGMPIYEVAAGSANAALAAAAADGYEQAAVIAADAPDVPGLILAKLLRPLTTRTVAVAAAGPDGGLLGVATRLPIPDWLPEIDLDTTAARTVRAAAPRPGDVAFTPSWRRLRSHADLAMLDPAISGWDNARALLQVGE
ncbi:MAG TPA: hypothetical protein VFX61_18685 [Micromonosporaceae bacterium]|nr:hypothetical protein [Micromonosporaceae bacterium]